MSDIYCLCGQAATPELVRNRILNAEHDSYMVITNRPVVCIKTGARRIHGDLATVAGTWRGSNVDIYECPNCGTKIAKG